MKKIIEKVIRKYNIKKLKKLYKEKADMDAMIKLSESFGVELEEGYLNYYKDLKKEINRRELIVLEINYSGRN